MLSIKVEQDYITWFNYAFPLYILLADDMYEGWYYENYIKLFTHLNDIDYFECGLVDALDYSIGGNMEIRLIPFSYVHKTMLIQINDIISMLKYNITINQYNVIFLDEFYISNLKRTEKLHYAHEFLIYGYDEEKKWFDAVGFIAEKFCELKLSYEEVEMAYHSAFNYIEDRDGWERRMLLMFGRFRSNEPYKFSMDVFKISLKEYLQGEYSNKDRFLSMMDERNENIPEHKVKCGCSTYEDFIEYFKLTTAQIEEAESNEDLEMAFSRYNAMHMLRDHKRGLYRRLEYIVNNIYSSSQLISLLKEYKNVWDESEIVRMLYLKGLYLKDISNKEKLKEISKRLLKCIQKMYKLEKDTLIAFLDAI